LPNNYTREKLSQIYKQERESQKERYVHYCQFTRLWNANFDNIVISRKVRMGICTICANVKSMVNAVRIDNTENDACRKALKENRDSETQERMKAMHQRDKSSKISRSLHVFNDRWHGPKENMFATLYSDSKRYA
jgi:hypothetical protein